jgi:hypothetical protein
MGLSQKLKIFLVMACLTTAYGCQAGKSGIANQLQGTSSNTCPDVAGTLDPKDVKLISISTQSVKETGTLRAGQNIGYTFDAKTGDKLTWRTAENLCVWVFTPSNKPLKSGDLPDNGKYTIQVSVPSGTTTYTLDMGLGNTVAAANTPVAPTIATPAPVAPVVTPQQPTTNPPTQTNVAASGSSLTQDQAVAVVQNWLNSKGRVFAAPFDRQLARQYTTGKRNNQILQSGGSIDWLIENRSYYTYAITRVDNVWAFDNSKSLVEIKLRVTEDLTLHNANGGIDAERSGRTTANYIYYLAQDNGTWKISDSQKTTD